MTNGIHNSGPWECSQHPGGHRMVLSPNHEGLLLPQQKILATISINFCKTRSLILFWKQNIMNEHPEKIVISSSKGNKFDVFEAVHNFVIELHQSKTTS